MAFQAIILASLLGTLVAGRPAEQESLTLGYPLILNPRVVGGHEARPGEFPWQVSLQWDWIFGGQHFCGGSIISEEWIVTAGHCVHAVPDYGTFSVIAGMHDLKKAEATQQKVEVLKSIVHEKYDGGVGPYDIALLKLSSPLKFDKAVKPIALPKANSDAPATLVLSGWGSTSKTSIPDMPDKLQTVKLINIDLVTCKKAIDTLVGTSPLHETNVCTGPITGGVSACSGDSGGPLIASGSDPTLIGVVSWGIIPCGTPGAPSVYAKVSSFVDWIANVRAKN